MNCRTLLAIVAGTSMSPLAQGSAQAPVAADPASLRIALGALRPSSPIRVQTLAFADVQGTLASVSDSTFTVASPAKSSALEIDRVRAVWVRGDAAKKGTAIGAITGGAVLGVFGALMATGMCEHNCQFAPIQGLAGGGVPGAAIGALAGFVVGTFVPAWRPYWDRERGTVSQRRPWENPYGWRPSLQAGMSTGDGPKTWLMGAAIERRLHSGRSIGLELMHVDAGTHRTEFGYPRNSPNEAPSFGVQHDTYTKSSNHLGLTSRQPLGEMPFELTAMAGVSRTTEEGDHYSVPAEPGRVYRNRSSGWSPVFGAGIATRFQIVNAELRWLGPAPAHGDRGSIVSVTARVTKPRSTN